MDINKLILDTESQVERLRRQAEQEKAMAEVMPVRFIRNLSAFKKHIPDIYEQFEEYVPIKDFRFFCNENGEPNILWLDEGVSLYGDNPYAESKAQIELILDKSTLHKFDFSIENNELNQIHVKYLNRMVELYLQSKEEMPPLGCVPNAIPMAFVFGVGLGYHLGYLYERCKINSLYIIEPDLDLFYASLFCFDWADLLSYLSAEKMGVHLLLGQDEDSLMKDLLPAIHKRGAFNLSGMFAYWHYPSPEIFKLIERLSEEFYTLKTGWGFFDDNLFAISHSSENVAARVPFLLKDKLISVVNRDTPVFVVGNGPSLDDALPYIEKYQEQALIICCGSSLFSLYKRKIKPDIYVAVERTKSSADFLDTIHDDAYLKDILFLSVDIIHPNCLKHFVRSGLAFKHNEPMYSMLRVNESEDIGKYSFLRCVNPLVGNTGLSYAVTLGFKSIYLFGLDNGYKSKEYHHAKSSSYYDESGRPIEVLKKLMTGRAEFSMAANFGGELITNQLFALSARELGNLLDMHPDVVCHNCSDGIAIKNATPLNLSELNFPIGSVNKKHLLGEIYYDLFSPISCHEEKFNQYLAVDVYNKLVDSIIDIWEKDFFSTDELNERMLFSFELITSFATSPFHHIYRILFGSVNYYFSVLNSMMYSFSNESETLNLVSRCVAIFIEFLKESKALYSQALSMKDQTNSDAIKHLRQNT